MDIGTFGAIIILFFFFLFKWGFRLLFIMALVSMGKLAKDKGMEAIKNKFDLGDGV